MEIIKIVLSIISIRKKIGYGKMRLRPPRAPTGGVFSDPQNPLAGFKGPTTKGRGGQRRRREGEEIGGR